MNREAAGESEAAGLPTPRPSVTKRQREQKKREKKLEKAERRALRKAGAGESGDPDLPETADDELEPSEAASS